MMKDNTNILHIKPETIHIDEQIVIRSMGYKEQTYPGTLPNIISKVLSELQSHLSIIAGWVICPQPEIYPDQGKILCNGKQFACGKIIVRDIRQSTELFVFVTTIGSGIAEWSNEQSKKNKPLEAYIIDTIGSIAVESAADIMCDSLLQKVAKTGKILTNRYSPGYCGWNIVEQHTLFSFFPPEFCGVRLTDSALMLPVKSVSGIIGCGENVKKRQYRCGICSQKDCIMRNVK